MNSAETTGVAALGRLFTRLATGGSATVAEFADSENLARSTSFDLVKRLEAGGFLERSAAGTLEVGPQFVALAYASHGLSRLHGPARPLLSILRDETGCTVSLVTADNATAATLLRLPGLGPASADHDLIEAALIDGDGRTRARLLVHVPQDTDADRREQVFLRLRRVQERLSRYLEPRRPAAHG